MTKMKGWIEVNWKGHNFFIQVSKIFSVVQNGDQTEIVYGGEENAFYYVDESTGEVMEKIRGAQLS